MPVKYVRQTLMFSATFPSAIQTLAREFLHNYLFLSVGQVGSANRDVTQAIHEVSRFEKLGALLDILQKHTGQRILVFVRRKRTADFLASMLSQMHFPATSIHG